MYEYHLALLERMCFMPYHEPRNRTANGEVVVHVLIWPLTSAFGDLDRFGAIRRRLSDGGLLLLLLLLFWGGFLSLCLEAFSGLFIAIHFYPESRSGLLTPFVHGFRSHGVRHIRQTVHPSNISLVIQLWRS